MTSEPSDNGSRWTRTLVIVLAVVLVLASIAHALDLYRIVGLQLYDQQFLFPMIGIGFLMVFLHFSIRGGRRRGPVPWYDWVLGLAGAGACGYLAWEYPRLADKVVFQPADAVACGTIILVLVAEGLRRTVGQVLLVVLLAFIAFGLAGQFVPGQLQGQPIDFGDLVTYLSFDTNALMGVPMRVVTSIVIAFLLMAALMRVSGAADFMNDLAIGLMGRYRGGAAKVAIAASSLFGSISGSVVSNVMSTGAITIPLMKKGGYPAHSAGAIEAVASTGGQLMPPVMGAVAFLMAEDLQVDYVDVAIAALVPSLLYYVSLFVQADLEAARDGIQRVPADQIPRKRTVLRKGWIFVLPFAVLVVGLFSFNLEPETAAIYASAVLIALGFAVGYQGRRMRLRDIWDSLVETGILALDLIMIGAAVGLIIGILAKSGLGFALTLMLVNVGGGSFGLLLILAALVCIVLGMGMPTLGVYVLVAALVAPAMIEVGVNAMAAHMFVLYFGMMSFITPPICIAAFAAARLADSDQMRTGFAAARFGWSAFVVPFLFVFSPSLVLQGQPLELVHDVATALAGVWLVSAGLIGFLFRRLSAAERALLILGGGLLLFPSTAIPGGLWTDLAGLAVAAPTLVLVYRNARLRRAAAAE